MIVRIGEEIGHAHLLGGSHVTQGGTGKHSQASSKDSSPKHCAALVVLVLCLPNITNTTPYSPHLPTPSIQACRRV